MALNKFETKDGRLGAWLAAGILTTGAIFFTGWSLNSRIPIFKSALGTCGAILGGLGILALKDCDDATRYEEVERETEYQEFLGACQANLRNVLNYLLAAAPLPGSSPGQIPAVPFAALPPGTEEPTPELNIKHLLNYPTVRVTGPQRSGKSRITEEIVRERCEAGCEAIVLDPHCKYGTWDGLKIVGRGKNYKEIQNWIDWFSDEVDRRYERFSNEPNYNPSPMLVVCEELTGWKMNGVKNAGKLLTIAVSEIDKIKISMVCVAHGKTNDLMGGSTGLAKTREAGFADLEMFIKLDEQTGKAVPKMEGILKLPGQDPQPVRIPYLSPLPPGTFERYGKKAAIAPTSPPAEDDFVQNHLPVKTLERSLNTNLTAEAMSPEEWELVEIGLKLQKRGQQFTARTAYRSAPGKRLKLDAASTKAMFERWAEFGLGNLETNKLPNGPEQAKFTFDLQ